MASIGINRLAASIGELCADSVLEEKWLLAPSLRIGFQWLDSVTRSGRPVLNARVKTSASMALELAAPEMERRGLSMPGATMEELLVGMLLGRLREKNGYLSRIEATPGLVRSAASTLRDLRLAGITAAALSSDCFEVMAKGRELISLLSAYEKELATRGLIDLADALRLAARRLVEDASTLPPGCIVAVPEDVLEDMRGLERNVWEAVPEDRRVVLAADRPCRERRDGAPDSALLAWASRPREAPEPTGDGSAEIFRAVGEINEVRELLRRCAGAGIPFDEVEILHTDADTYVPLIYEACSLLEADPGSAIPVTFSEGIPVRYSRPGRALAAWLSWIAEGFPQSTLSRMVQDGLLDLGTAMENGWSFSQLGAVLRALPIAKGRDRYLTAIDAELSSLEWRVSRCARDENGREERERRAYLERRTRMLNALRDMTAELFNGIPETSQGGIDLLESAGAFLSARARKVNELDEYGHRSLLDAIEELASCLRESGVRLPQLHVRDWLAGLARSSRVEGKGPRPGCLYVASLAGGGHSGRPYTYIVGLDDGRFPGVGRQDPLLLDSERVAISEELPTAAERLAATFEDFARVAARTRGDVTLSYSSRSLDDDRDMFPSPVLLSAYRIVSGDREGMQEDFLASLPEPASFAPQDRGRCLSASEWWICRLCGDPAPRDPLGTVARAFPHLGRGLLARRARESDLFTEYDGYVPEAGRDLDPSRPGGPVLSASRLETLGRCPMEYFFAYVLGIKPPEEYPLDPSRWLEPTEKGSLLHTVFRKFHLGLREEGRRPELDRDWAYLRTILAGEIEEWSRRKPPPCREAYEREAEDLRRTARIFLREEEEHCRDRYPLYFEVAIGLEAEGEGNPVDSAQPVEIALPGGRTVRTRGYIDRIDELGVPGSLRFSVCDYKTGSAFGYEREDPFRRGRRVQSFIYLVQAQSRLAECHPGARVDSFQYFFPSSREHGERMEWDARTLARGMDVLEKLCEMLSMGSFPFSDDTGDVSISDYKNAFGDTEAAAAAARKKLSNPGNAALAPMRVLRGYVEEGNG